MKQKHEQELCPYCNAKVRHGRLHAHIRKEHQTRHEPTKWSSRKKILLRSTKVLLCLLPVVLGFNWFFGYAYPHNSYPISNIENRVWFPKEANVSVLFLPAKINTKQIIEINVHDLATRDFEISYAYYYNFIQPQNVTINTSPFNTGLPFNDVTNIDISFDGRKLEPAIVTYGEEKYYVMPGLSFNGTIQSHEFKFSFSAAKRYSTYSRLVDVPWLFTRESYSTLVHIPLLPVLLEMNSTSDAAILKVRLESEYYRVFADGSGWMAYYTTPANEVTTRSVITDLGKTVSVVQRYRFEYQITQKYTASNDGCSFTTSFDKDNLADRVTLVFIPKGQVFVLPWLIFPCFYFAFYVQPYVTRKRNMRIKLLSAYSLYVAFPLAGLILQFDYVVNLLGIVVNLVGFVNLVILLSFPVVYSVVLQAWRPADKAKTSLMDASSNV